MSRWCLSGTPLQNAMRVHGLDRLFTFLHAGIKASQLSSLRFCQAFGQMAIRYTKDGAYQVRLAILCSSPAAHAASGGSGRCDSHSPRNVQEHAQKTRLCVCWASACVKHKATQGSNATP